MSVSGEEVLLDYGDSWQHEFDVHTATFVHPPHSEDYKVAWDYDNGKELFTKDDPKHPPPYVESRCWIDFEEESLDEDGFYIAAEVNSDDIEETVPCTLIGKEVIEEDDEEITFYKVSFFDEESEEEVLVKGVAWRMIMYFDKAYTGNQHLRQGFRHFIELPDDMIPPSWRDLGLGIEDNSECGLWMAESAIPHSGLGMYTGRDVEKNDRIAFGDVVVQVEDIRENIHLRMLYDGNTNYTEEEWLLEHYYWTAESSNAQFDAGFIQSMVPGFGMLANSHTGLHNSAMRLPYQTMDLHRDMDPGAGVATVS